MKNNASSKPKTEKTEQKRKTKKRFSLDSFFGDSRVVLIISFILSLFLWIVVSMYASPVDVREIKNVKVTLNLEDSLPAKLNLAIFGEKEFYVDVTVRGKRYQLSDSALAAENLQVIAQMNYVDKAGINTLPLKASFANGGGSLEIISLSRTEIDVYFDTLKTQQYTLEPQIIHDGFEIAAEGFISETPILSSSVVELSGPATEINKIKDVYAKTTLKEPLSTNSTLPVTIEPKGEGSEPLKYIESSSGDITMTIPIKKIMTLPTTVSFINAPLAYSEGFLDMSFEPKQVKAAVSAELADTVDSFPIGILDFSTLSLGVNVREFPPVSSAPITILDDSIKSFRVAIDTSKMKEAVFDIPLTNFSAANVPEGKKVTPMDGTLKEVRIIGLEQDIASLNADGIYVETDLSSQPVTDGIITVPVKIFVKSNTSCWAYGEYKVRVRVSAK